MKNIYAIFCASVTVLLFLSGTVTGGEEVIKSETVQEQSKPGNGESRKESREGKQTEFRGMDNAAARVNGITISRSDLDKSYNSYIQQRGMDTGMISDPNRYKQVQLEVLESLIARELLWQEAKKKKFVAKDEDVATALDSVKSSFPSESDFTLRLTQLGYTEKDYTDFLRQQLSVRTLVQEDIAKGISILDDEVHGYYESNPEQFEAPEQVRARHILVKVEPGADEAVRGEARAKIDTILEEARGGADFAGLATKHSEGPSGPKGGDLGFFSKGQMVKPFADVAFALKPGEISGVVQTVYGYHIIMVEERKEPEVITEESVREQIRQYLYSGKVREAVQKRVNVLREKGTVEILLPL